jgi:transcriptional regulator with XRE-family HTH domain
MGWSIEQAAEVIGVDPGSWSKWERGQTVLYRQHRIQVASFLNISAVTLGKEMSARWNLLHERTPDFDSE